MHHILFGHDPEIAILIRQSGLRKQALLDYYIKDRDSTKFIGFSLEMGKGKKPKKAEMTDYLSELMPTLEEQGVTTLLVCDPNYFKALTGSKNTSAARGYVLPCVTKGYEHMNCILVPNHQAVIYDPEGTREEIGKALMVLDNHVSGGYVEPGTGIIHYEEYINSNTPEFAQWLQKLHQYPELTCDTEAYSLKHFSAGLGTITFCWNKHEGICVDMSHSVPETEQAKQLLREFFETYKGNLKYHNACFDIKILIYHLWMNHLLDTEGLLKGLEVLTRDFDCTKIISYLATNSAAGNNLSLKYLSQEYTGNYAVEEINDITKIPIVDLMRYNLIDGLATWYVYGKYYPQMVADQQEEVYVSLFKPAIKQIIQMELTGLPVNMVRVKEVRTELQIIQDTAISNLAKHPTIQVVTRILQEIEADKANLKLKKIRKTWKDFEHKVKFNPNSDNHLRVLLYEYLKFEVVNTTDGGQPSCDADSIKIMLNTTKDASVLEILKNLKAFADVAIILSTFIPAFEGGVDGGDGRHYVFGNFNIGGTVSGRLSSSSPNLQNLPSGSAYGKAIKSCVQAPDGWLWVGLDFASLEDRISALTTKDSAKLKVYTDHYDGHSLRAASYFPEEMPDIKEYSEGKAFKITFDDGSTKLMHETEARKHGYIP